MYILTFPPEILALIPTHLPTIEDHLSLSSTSRAFYHACQSTPPQIILRLCAAQERVFFRPSPYYLILCCARRLRGWVLCHHISSTSSNTDALIESRKIQLRDAFRGGIYSLRDLCVSVCGLTLADIRRMYNARFSTINPLMDAINKMAGHQWAATDDYWYDGVSEAGTICAEPERASMQILIYVELFSGDMEAALNPGVEKRTLGLELRLEYIKYCIPDRACKGGYPGLEVLEIGPYAEDAKVKGIIEDEYLVDDQVSVAHILSCRRWVKKWEAVARAVGPRFTGTDLTDDVDADRERQHEAKLKSDDYGFQAGPNLGEGWRQRLWITSMYMQGIESMEVMLKVDEEGAAKMDEVGDEKWRERFIGLRSKVAALTEQDRPEVHTIGRAKREASDAPDLWAETCICTKYVY
ncbi:MAG: hypothetical protein M1820_002353 [Bogoriella megaspora]|nr:MAG: hypothetical protein M1820_002353 [Bogoriella megaspora]